jgi:ABC-type branched-subunit amino acid transport system ATPase component
MTVRENLEIAGFVYRNDQADFDRRVTRIHVMFPELSQMLEQSAGSMSGGQQQMLALAATLLHEPEILIIDELSLGLAPVIVQRLLVVTIIIVEQSINVALSIADRAVFLEKGRVQFEGNARDLLERGDLVRAVFLGTEGG